MAAASTGSGIPLSPKQFIAQWQHLPHKFQLNVWNFEVKAGKAIKDVFQKSFDMKKFNSSDSLPWAARSKNSRGIHPLMVETETLKNSIKWKHMGEKDSPKGVTIYTDENTFSSAARHKGFCYAAVHNGPNSYRRKHMKKMPRRQFMGYSSEAKDEITKLSKIVFEGFPK